MSGCRWVLVAMDVTGAVIGLAVDPKLSCCCQRMGATAFSMGNNPERQNSSMPMPASTDELFEYERDKLLGKDMAHVPYGDHAGDWPRRKDENAAHLLGGVESECPSNSTGAACEMCYIESQTCARHRATGLRLGPHR